MSKAVPGSIDRGDTFSDLVRNHSLRFGEITGLEDINEIAARNMLTLSPSLWWWGPRSAFPREELFVTHPESSRVFIATYEHFTTNFNRDLPGP